MELYESFTQEEGALVLCQFTVFMCAIMATGLGTCS